MSKQTELEAVEWVSGKVRPIDQSKLQQEELYLELSDHHT